MNIYLFISDNQIDWVYLTKDAADKFSKERYGTPYETLEIDFNLEFCLLTKQECLALVELWDNAYLSSENSLTLIAYRKIYNFAIQK